MFQQIGKREFTFIQHMSAVMGFVCGFFQMMLWLVIKSGSTHECNGTLDFSSYECWIGLVILPVSGLLIGYFTNWLGITMIFRPVLPHIVCGGYVNIQGVFLKRQKEVSKKLARKICENLVHAGKMMEYVVKRQDTVDKVCEIYQRHMRDVMDQVIGRAKAVIPVFVGDGAMQGIQQEA